MNQYRIDVPPPTISGELHIGHLYSYAQMDFYARWRGKDCLYCFCADYNGIPTEALLRSNPEAIELSLHKYKTLFGKIEMSWNGFKYGTHSQQAQYLAELSFNDLLRKGYLYKKLQSVMYLPSEDVYLSDSEVNNGICIRTGEPIEDRLEEGWFIKVIDFIPQIKEQVDKIKWHPDIFRERLHSWLDNVNEDWSISRKRKYGLKIPDTDLVFDTWFVSSLSPQLMNGSTDLNVPVFDLRWQGHDIIRTWALFTIIKSLYHNNQIPWTDIAVTGHALDSTGRKMSKSKGNAPDPNLLLKKYGAEGIRHWAALAALGTDVKVNEHTMSQAKRILTKIKNAQRFIEMNPSDKECENQILFRQMCNQFDRYMENFEHHHAYNLLYRFFFDEFCGKMIEKCKISPFNLNDMMREIKEMFVIFLGDFVV